MCYINLIWKANSNNLKAFWSNNPNWLNYLCKFINTSKKIKCIMHWFWIKHNKKIKFDLKQRQKKISSNKEWIKKPGRRGWETSALPVFIRAHWTTRKNCSSGNTIKRTTNKNISNYAGFRIFNITKMGL